MNLLVIMLGRAKRLVRKTINLLCPPTCAFCGESSGVSGYTGLCAECSAKYVFERSMSCPSCGETAGYCKCSDEFTKFTKTTINERSCISLTFYTTSSYAGERGRITENMILQLKNKGSFAKFFANELADEIEKTFIAGGIKLDEWTLTYPPRSISNFMKYGIDQSEEITKYLSKRLGIPCVKTFVKIEGSEQKALNSAERKANADNTLLPRRSAIISGSKYILFDDIITTGATITTAARHLYYNGADKVFPVSIARTPGHRQI